MKNRFIKIAFSLLVGGVVVFLLGYFWRMQAVPEVSVAESEEALKQNLGRALKDEQTQMSDGVYKGRNFSLEYPKTAKPYDEAKLVNKDPNVSEYFSFDGYNPRMVFTASVASISGRFRNLEEVPGVSMRENNEDYSKEGEIIGTDEGVKFLKVEGGFEQTLFLIKDNRLFTFSLTSESGADLKQEFEQIINSLRIN